MEPADITNHEVIFQKFKSEDGTRLGSLPTCVCEETGERYILWKNIQNAFVGVSHLEDRSWGLVSRAWFIVDQTGELRQPLGVKVSDNPFYVVFSKSIREQQADETNHNQLEINKSSSHRKAIDSSEIQGNVQSKPNDELMLLSHLFDTCIDVYKQLESTISYSTVAFKQVSANSRYYYLLLVEEVKKVNQTGVKAQVNGKDPAQMLEEIGNLEKQVADWEYRNIFQTMLAVKDTGFYSATSLFFVVLPLSLDSWDDLDPSSHRLRLYFLCENRKYKDAAALSMPQHIHFSNHPGYSLKRAQEFFHTFGDYVLRILLMIKHGYSDDQYEIPPLDTFNILWHCSPDVFGSHITKDTIGPLINKAITYLQELSPPTWGAQLWLSQAQSAAVKTFLDVQEGDNAEANLFRYTYNDLNVTWRCQAHTYQYIDHKSLAALRDFTHGHGGHIDMRKGTLSIELATMADADQLQALVSDAKYRLDFSVKLSWRATRSYIKHLFVNIGNNASCVLEIDGITPDNHPQSYHPYQHSLFCNILEEIGIDFITLLNYPRPQQQTTQFREFAVQSAFPSVPLLHRWMSLRSEIRGISDLVCKAQTALDYEITIKKLSVALEKYQVPEASVITLYNYGWSAVFDLEKRAIVEVHSKDDKCPKELISLRSLRTLGLQLCDLGFDQEFFHIVQTNAGLQEVNIAHERNNVLHHIEHIVGMWHESASPFRLLLLDRLQDTQSRVVAELVIREGGVSISGNNICNVQECGPNHEFLQWSCDNISPPLSNYFVVFLDEATKQHPSTLASFTLDVSQLSTEGFSAVQNILRRSHLEHFHVVCSHFDRLSLSITQVLGSVQWLTIKSLVLSGYNISGWMDLWTCPFAPQLLCFHIQGAGSTMQELSHLNVLFLLDLVYSSPMAELHLTNVQLQDKRDWVLLIESVNWY